MMAMCWNQRSLLRESTGIGRPFGREILGEFDGLVAQLHSHDAHAQPEDTVEMLEVLACDLGV